MVSKKLKPYQLQLLREHKIKSAEFQGMRRLIHSKQFHRYYPEERVLMVKQMNLLKALVQVLDERIEVFRTKETENG